MPKSLFHSGCQVFLLYHMADRERNGFGGNSHSQAVVSPDKCFVFFPRFLKQKVPYHITECAWVYRITVDFQKGVTGFEFARPSIVVNTADYQKPILGIADEYESRLRQYPFYYASLSRSPSTAIQYKHHPIHHIT